MAIKCVSARVPKGNRWHSQMRIIPGELIYKGTVSDVEVWSTAVTWFDKTVEPLALLGLKERSFRKYTERTEQQVSVRTLHTASQKPLSRKEDRAFCISNSSFPRDVLFSCQDPFWCNTP